MSGSRTGTVDRGLAERSADRRRRAVGNRARDFHEAERWDLQFWASRTPEERILALEELRRDASDVGR
ncbi:MAG: hypothetical protein FJ098_16415 [Deltaproteobacteria bacterium]|nr:hypothetical protein [Deltaproteobacteria bacterium]